MIHKKVRIKIFDLIFINLLQSAIQILKIIEASFYILP